MYKIKIIFLICFMLLFCGCFRNYDVYGFKTVSEQFEWGLAGAKLIGTESREGNTIIKNSPYELFIWFGSESFMEGSVSIEDITLINKRTGNIVFMKKDTLEKQIEEQSNLYRAYFSFKNIKMPYENTELLMTFQLKNGAKLKRYQVRLLFETDHQKFRRIIGV